MGNEVDFVCDYSCGRVRKTTGRTAKSRRRMSSTVSSTPSLEFDRATLNSPVSSPNSSPAMEEMDCLIPVKLEDVETKGLASNDEESVEQKFEGIAGNESQFSYFTPAAPPIPYAPIYHPVPMTISLFSPLTQFPLAFPKIVPPSPSYHPCLPAHFSNTLHVLDTLTLPIYGHNDTITSPVHNFSPGGFANITPFGRLELSDDHALRAGWGGIPRSTLV